MKSSELEKAEKFFGAHAAVHAADLQIAPGELHALLGPSGCGKTTVLRLFAGFETPDRGRVRIAGEEVAGPNHWVPPERRQVGMVFQEYHLFPHLSVLKNVLYGLPPNGSSKHRAGEVLEMVGLAGHADAFPHMLSGGQQQRVAMARALAPKPRMLLMDEPFSNLDAKLRLRLRSEIRSILKAADITTLLVTHDQEEALSIADTVSIMLDGRILQTSPPRALYFRPISEFVAQFVGDANFVEGRANQRTVHSELGDLLIDEELQGPVRVLLRPESLRVHRKPPPPEHRAIEVEVRSTQFFGHDQLLTVRLPQGSHLLARVGPEWQAGPGQKVFISPQGVMRAFQLNAGPGDSPANRAD